MHLHWSYLLPNCRAAQQNQTSSAVVSVDLVDSFDMGKSSLCATLADACGRFTNTNARISGRPLDPFKRESAYGAFRKSHHSLLEQELTEVSLRRLKSAGRSLVSIDVYEIASNTRLKCFSIFEKAHVGRSVHHHERGERLLAQWGCGVAPTRILMTDMLWEVPKKMLRSLLTKQPL